MNYCKSYKSIQKSNNRKRQLHVVLSITISTLKILKVHSNDKTLKFKTNINCSGCVAKVAPFLDDAQGICHWDMDTAGKDKILSVHSQGITEQEVIRKVQEAGFKIESLT